jgi:hypothetical protein
MFKYEEILFVALTGVEPVRTFRPTGFSWYVLYHGLCLNHIFRLRLQVYSLYTFRNYFHLARRSLYLFSKATTFTELACFYFKNFFLSTLTFSVSEIKTLLVKVRRVYLFHHSAIKRQIEMRFTTWNRFNLDCSV